MLGLEVATYIVHWQFKLCTACSGADIHVVIDKCIVIIYCRIITFVLGAIFKASDPFATLQIFADDDSIILLPIIKEHTHPSSKVIGGLLCPLGCGSVCKGPLLGLGRLSKYFCLLFYCFILNALAYYSFTVTYLCLQKKMKEVVKTSVLVRCLYF